jgi:hypothetical protein
MLIIFYTGGFDTGISRWIGDNVANNWFGIYNRTAADQGFQFFIHDNEHSLGSDYPDHASQFIDRTGPFNNGNQNNFAQFAPPYLHQDLLASPEYKQLFIDRVQKFMFNGGALTAAESVARLLDRKNQVDPAIIAEAARWGDSKVATPYNKTTWQNEVNWLVNTYFPSRGNTVLNQLRTDGLYTTFAAPSFSQFGGSVPNNYPLTITFGAGTIYYTTDGVTDPRMIGGGVNPSPAVKPYTGGVPISGATTVMARLRTAGGQWSGLVEATFATVTLPGDYNGSGDVTQQDYAVWKSSFGDAIVAGSGADGNGNGLVDAADYSVWRDHLGTSLGLGSGAESFATVAAEAAAEPVAELPAAQNVTLTLSPSLDYVAADSFPALPGTTSFTTYSRQTAGRPAFDNLLLAATRVVPPRPPAALYDRAFDDFAPDDFASSDFASSDFASIGAGDDDLLAILATETLGFPQLVD